MERIELCTDVLVEALQESEEYQRFCAIRDQVSKDSQLRQRINDFRRHIFEVQNAKESPDLYGEMERIGREYEEFRRNPAVAEFLQAELRVCRILQQVMKRITESVDLDTQSVLEGMQVR